MNKYCLLTYMLFLGIALKGQSLNQINIDDLSDAQVLSIFEKGKANGYSLENSEALARSIGLSEDDFSKFKIRLDSLITSEAKQIENLDFTLNSDLLDQKVEEKYISKPQIDNKPLPDIFGHKYFQIDLESFDQSKGAKAPRNYILGSGDELTISVFGSSYFQETFEVNESGILNLGPKFGRLKVRGMLFKNVERLIRARFSRGFDFSKNTFDLSLTYGRNITVNVVGEVNNPGTYSLSALNNAFHLLSVAGGPNELGSLRNVKIYRDGDMIEVIDFYKFLTNPRESKMPFLQDGDFVMVPAISNLVHTSGSFKRQTKFEVLPNETLANLLQFSGGFSSDAYNKKVKIFRKDDNENKIIDVFYDEFSSIILNNGDSLFADFKSGVLKKYVNISGALAQPGDFGFTEGMKLGDLINLAGGIVGRFPDKEILLSRLGEDGEYDLLRVSIDDDISNFDLQVFDHIHISSRTQDLNYQKVTIVGAVNNPGSFKYSDGMTLDDAVKISGGLMPYSDNERIEIIRKTVKMNSSGSLVVSTQSIFVSVDRSMLGSWSEDYTKSNFLLKPSDIITIRRIKKFGLSEMVQITGEVRFPGTYQIINSEERVLDLIKRSGGLLGQSDIFNARLFSEIDTNIVFRLDKSYEDQNFNYILRAKDSLYIPRKTNLVAIKGNGHQLYFETNKVEIIVPFNKGYRAKKYINKYALGTGVKSDVRNIAVSYPNGQLERSKNFLIWTITPKVKSGGVVLINKKAKTKKDKKVSKPIDWNQVVATLTSAAMGFGTVYALINRP